MFSECFSENAMIPEGKKNTVQAHFQNQMSSLVAIKIISKEQKYFNNLHEMLFFIKINLETQHI